MSVIRLNRVLCAHGREAILTARLADVAERTRGEPTCISYRWFRAEGSGDETPFIGLSEWRDAHAWRAHLEGPAFAAFFAAERDDPCLVGAPDHSDLTDVTENNG